MSTVRGNYLIELRRETIRNPTYTPPEHSIGMPAARGNGPYIDMYYLLENNAGDTIKLYINPYVKGKIMIPVGLKFSNY